MSDSRDNETGRQAEPDAEERLLWRYMDGELRSSERRMVEERLVREEGLARRLAEMQSLAPFFRAAGEDPVPLGLGFGDRVWAGIHRREVHASPGSRDLPTLLRTWILVAASALVLLSLGTMLTLPRRTSVLEAEQTTEERLEQLDRKVEILLEEREEKAKKAGKPDRTGR
ncbi:MAG: anti-sigma factor family protein [Planctomycetota bacterium]